MQPKLEQCQTQENLSLNITVDKIMSILNVPSMADYQTSKFTHISFSCKTELIHMKIDLYVYH